MKYTKIEKTTDSTTQIGSTDLQGIVVTAGVLPLY